MSPLETLQKIWKDREKEISAQVEKMDGALRKAQSGLLDMIIQKGVSTLVTDSNGNILPTDENIKTLTSLNNSLDNYLTQYVDSPVVGWGRELLKVTDLSEKYYNAIGIDDLPNNILQRARQALGQAIGISFSKDLKTTSIVEGGYLDTMMQNNPLKQEIRSATIAAIFGGQTKKQFSESIERIVVGADGQDGKLLRYYKQYIYDTHAMALSASDHYLAKHLKLKKFLYEGSLIETSRPFCQERSGKVFTDSHIKQWDAMEWAGKNKTSSFVISRGGYNCRHWLNWITDEMADQFKSGKKEQEDPKQEIPKQEKAPKKEPPKKEPPKKEPKEQDIPKGIPKGKSLKDYEKLTPEMKKIGFEQKDIDALNFRISEEDYDYLHQSQRPIFSLLRRGIENWQGKSEFIREGAKAGASARDKATYQLFCSLARNQRHTVDTVWRCLKMRMSQVQFLNNKIGKKIKFGEKTLIGEKTYNYRLLSSSRSQEFAERWAYKEWSNWSDSPGNVQMVVWEVKNKKGIRGMEVERLDQAGYRHEQEIIFGGDHEYKILGITRKPYKDTSMIVIRIEQIETL